MALLESLTYPGRYLRHRDVLVDLDALTDRPAGDFSFEFVPRGSGRVALRSNNDPARYLRRSCSGLLLQGPGEHHDLRSWRADTTFAKVRGLESRSGISLRSTSCSCCYLRVSGGHPFVAPLCCTAGRPDATFLLRADPTPPAPARARTSIPMSIEVSDLIQLPDVPVPVSGPAGRSAGVAERRGVLLSAVHVAGSGAAVSERKRRGVLG